MQTKLYKFALGAIFVLFLALLFYHLSIQEFIGDEASPMLNIDRMWDAIPLHDPRFLAYPYLFYYSPYLSIFSGTLLHFFGPNRILLRIPSILFSIATYFLFIYIFRKEKVNRWLVVFALLAYVCSGLIRNERSGAGDAQTRFFILVASYYTWKFTKEGIQKQIQIALVSFTFGALTMLDTVILIPALAYALWKQKFLKHRKTAILVVGIIILFICYFSLWLLFPYLAFKNGYQNYLSDRGFFYYLSRAKIGSSGDTFSSIKWFIYYTSLIFVLWCAWTALACFFIKKLRPLLILTIPSWIAVFLLKNSSIHVVMYTSLFLMQAVIVTNYYIEQYSRTKYFIIALLCLIVLGNTYNLFSHFGELYQFNPHLVVHKSGQKNCLDESVIRIYQKHHVIPLDVSCNYPLIK